MRFSLSFGRSVSSVCRRRKMTGSWLNLGSINTLLKVSWSGVSLALVARFVVGAVRGRTGVRTAA